MTSNMLAGEKRWVSARRGGMTVLGKVAVPKPINLPSQRLENNGLDPNVEIVPKGTLSWGNRSSSSAPNAWGSTAVSPKADGGSTSPRHVSGRPSSASGSRPATAGSDRNLDPIANAWNQNSRPSSASGVLTSNQTAPTSLRPRSADTRPGSSQLSRFAEAASDNQVTWGPNRASERLGMISSRKDGFSLDSGDFPTLGTEKDSTKKANSQEDSFNGRPRSSSGEAEALEKEKTVTSSVGDISVNVNVKSESSNAWRRDGPQHVDDVAQHAFERWQADSSPYLNTTIPPQHFDAWHGAPINPPAEAWFSRPPGGLPYGPPLGPGGFPIESFPFYQPQIRPALLSNSQHVPPQGAGPRGNYPKNGDLYMPNYPEAYMQPGLPMRPGFFPGPMAYDGYYGPPMAFHNPNERDVPLMGKGSRPSFSHRYPGENVSDPRENHARAGAHSTMGKPRLPEKVESGKHEDNSGPYRILKQQDVSDEKHRQNKLENAIPLSVPSTGKGEKSRSSSQKYEWGLEEETGDEDIFSEGPPSLSYSKDYDKRGSNTSNSVKADLHDNRGKTKAAGGSSADKLENAAFAVSQAPQAVITTQKNPVLIQKIESLNAKARTGDGRPDAVSFAGREGKKMKSQVVDAKAKVFVHDSGVAATQCFDATHASGSFTHNPSDVDSYTADKILRPVSSGGLTSSRGVGHGVQVKHDHRGKRFSTQVADGLQKRPVAPEYASAVPVMNSEPNPRVQLHGRLPSEEVSEKYGVNQGKYEGELQTQFFDAGDGHEQRAKMREIAKQRAIQLQKEEEERTREQKAKALAKLEELNKRTQAINSSNQKLESPSGLDLAVPVEREERRVPAEEVTVARKAETRSILAAKPSAQIRDAAVAEATDLPKDNLVHSSDGTNVEAPVPLPSRQNPSAAFAAGHKEAVSQVGDGNDLRNKRIINKQKQNNLSVKTLPEKSMPRGPTEKSDNHVDVVVNDVSTTEVVAEASAGCESSLPVNSSIIAESTQQKRKSGRSTKNKHKTDNLSSVVASPLPPSVETHTGEVSGKTTRPELEVQLDPASVQSITAAKHPIQELDSSLPFEEANGRTNNHWKSQQSRKIPRNQQASRPAEKLHSNDALVWAPVRPLNKPSDEASDKTVHPTGIASIKSDNIVQHSHKNKRAEMERYVPKPVAKELAQQGILQQSATSSLNRTTSGNTAASVQSATSSVNRTPAGDSVEAVKSVEKSEHGNSSSSHIVSTVESKNGDDKKKRQQKPHGSSWRQRGSVEPAKSLLDGSSASESGKNIHETPEQRTAADVNYTEEKMKTSNDCKSSDGKGAPDKSDMETRVVKDQGATGRGKRHVFKGNNRNLGHSDGDSGYIDKSFSQTMPPEVAGQTSQWQPKAQVHMVNTQNGKKTGGGEKVFADVSSRKEWPSQDRFPPPNDQSVSEEKNVSSASSRGNQSSHRPGQHVSGSQNNQRFPSGYRKVDNQNYRAGREHDFRDEWSSSGHDDRYHSSSFNRERHGHNSNYEYQPVAQHNINKPNNFEGSFDGSQGRGSRYKERNQGHPRRGGGNNSYGRQSGTVRVDAN